MANTINATDLAVIVAGAITAGQQVTIYDQSGNAGRAAIEDVVSAANRLNSELGIKTAKVDIPTAEVLTLNTTPKAFGLIVPTGFYVQLLSAQMKATYNSATYATNTELEVGFAGVKPVFLDSVLGFGSSTFVNLDYNDSGAVSAASDVIVSVNNGNPTVGNSDITIYITYSLIEL
jgi:hypothetical protein